MAQLAQKIFDLLVLVVHPRHWARPMAGVNRLDQYGPSCTGGGDQEMKVLKEICELQELENENWSRGECITNALDSFGAQQYFCGVGQAVPGDQARLPHLFRRAVDEK
jgi:hypothetical protein